MPKLFLEGGGAHNFILFYFIFVEARKKNFKRVKNLLVLTFYMSTINKCLKVVIEIEFFIIID